MAKSSSRRSSRRAARALPPEERAAQDAARHAPVGLPSGGSFEVDRLQKGLDAAVDHQPGNRDAEVRKALDDARSDAGDTRPAPSVLPGHTLMKTEVQIVPPSGEDDAGVNVTEFRQVNDPDLADEAANAPNAGAATAGGQAVAGGPSQVLSSEPVAPEEVPVVAESDTSFGALDTSSDIDTGGDDQ